MRCDRLRLVLLPEAGFELSGTVLGDACVTVADEEVVFRGVSTTIARLTRVKPEDAPDSGLLDVATALVCDRA